MLFPGTSRTIESYLLDLSRCTEFQERNGVTRRLYTAAWKQAQSLILDWMCEANLDPWIDAVGNVHGRVEGFSGQTILTGSHLDTVVDGGAYDGAYGIIAGIMALGEIKSRQIPLPRSLEVVALCEEEGSRFPMTCWGSRTLLGKISREDLALQDADSVSVTEAMQSCGLNPHEIDWTPTYHYQGFIELHIEQASQLESAHCPIGVADTIFGQERWNVTVIGESVHAGTSRIVNRHDALVAASEMVLDVYRLAQQYEDQAIGTVGLLQVQNGTSNCVPGHVNLTVDLRAQNDALREVLASELRRMCKECGRRYGVEIVIEPYTFDNAVSMNVELQNLIQQAAQSQRLDVLRLDSRAGHDAQIFGTTMPTAMIFVPSHQGLSHHANEFTKEEDLINGQNVLREVLERAANGMFS